MEYRAELCRLSEVFYDAYPASEYPEILTKNQRPYTCLTIETHDGYLICVPFRSSINHKEAFLFTDTERSRRTKSGLDYKKTVIINNDSYIIRDESISVDNDEYTSMLRNIDKIVHNINNYIKVYINHINGINILHPREYMRRYQYSTLPYFNDILTAIP